MPTPKYSLLPKKSLGQHFLRDPNTARKIISSLSATPDEPIVEIGPGTGALTSLLSERYEHVTAIEIDQRAAQLLLETHPRVTLVCADVLRTDWGELARLAGKRLHIIGNLPYNITSQILFSLLDAREHLSEAVVMMQYEVARRLVAEPATKAYGILSVAIQQVATPRFLFPVSANVFRPKPDVRSAVVRIDFLERPAYSSDMDHKWTRIVVRTAFNQRRKTLRNSLRELASGSGRAVPDAFKGKRAEELTPEDFVDLARYLQFGS